MKKSLVFLGLTLSSLIAISGSFLFTTNKIKLLKANTKNNYFITFDHDSVRKSGNDWYWEPYPYDLDDCNKWSIYLETGTVSGYGIECNLHFGVETNNFGYGEDNYILDFHSGYRFCSFSMTLLNVTPIVAETKVVFRGQFDEATEIVRTASSDLSYDDVTEWRQFDDYDNISRIVELETSINGYSTIRIDSIEVFYQCYIYE